MPETTASIVLKLKDEASKSLKGLNKEFISFKSVLKGATVAAAALTGAAVAVAAFAAKGEEIRALRQSFVDLTAGIGENANAMLAAMQEATSGLVSNSELIVKANNAILLGLPVTTESMSEMAEAATVLGRAMGIDATSALDSMILGLGRQSKLILDNLGITVDTAAANEVYAAELGKTADELTEAERKQAFYNSTMTAAKLKVEELGAVTLGFGGNLKALRTTLINAFDDMQVWVSVFADAVVKSLGTTLGSFDSLQKALVFNAKTATEFAKTALVGLVDGFVLVAGAVFSLLDAFNIMQVAIGVLAAAFIESFRLMIAPLELVLFTMRKVATAVGAEGIAGQLEIARQSVIGFTNDIHEAAKTSFDWGKQGVADIEANRKALEKLSDKAGDLRAGLVAVSAVDVAIAAEALSGSMDAAATAMETISSAAQTTAETVGALTTVAADSTKDLAAATEKSVADGLVAAIAGGDAQAAVRSLGDFLEGVAIIGIDIGAILNAITSINKELPALLFESIRQLLINVIKELPLIIGAIIPDLVIPLLKLLPEITKGFGRNLPVMIDMIIESLPELVEALIVAVFAANPVVLIAQIIASALDAAMEMWLPGFKEEMINFLLEDVMPVFENMRDFFESIPALFQDAADNIMKPFQFFADAVSQLAGITPGGAGAGGLESALGIDLPGVSFQQGTPFVPFTGPALLHRGEAVIPAAMNARGGGINVEINIPMNVTLTGGATQATANQFSEMVARAFEKNERALADRVRRVIEQRG